MENILPYLAVLACPIGMGLCMWLMAKGMRKDHAEPAQARGASVEELRSEHERLGAEIERLEGSDMSARPERHEVGAG